jgi:hypothetical protein
MTRRLSLSDKPAACHEQLPMGLSRMQGNLHVRFLGEAAAATLWPYPLIRLCF